MPCGSVYYEVEYTLCMLKPQRAAKGVRGHGNFSQSLYGIYL